MTTVALGSKLKIELNGEPKTIRIRRPNVPDEESEPEVTLVSPDTPIAKALLNAEEGEELEFMGGNNTPNKIRVLRILS